MPPLLPQLRRLYRSVSSSPEALPLLALSLPLAPRAFLRAISINALGRRRGLSSYAGAGSGGGGGGGGGGLRAGDAEALRRLEAAANRAPTSASAQQAYLYALQGAGFGDEVVQRIESGRFATSWPVLDLYARCLADVRRLREADVSEARQRLHALWSQAGERSDAFLPADALRFAALGGGGGGRSGYFGGLKGGGDPYFGFGSGGAFASPGPAAAGAPGQVMGAGAGAGSAAVGATGSHANPMVVEVTTGRAGNFANVMRLISMGIFLAVAYHLITQRIPNPLMSMAGDIVEEVTDIPTTRFSDVKGVDEAKGELQDIVEFLRDPERFKRLGAKVPRGLLLTGPPGTGKTLLARAVAGEAGCKFYSKSASEFEEMLVGLGAKRVRELFASARKNAPAIIFIDEIDALGGKRKVSIGGGSERQTLNQLLSSMDGFTKNENVIVIGATNSPDILDAALTRPGRFDSTVDVPLPDVRGRREIIDLYLGKVIVAKNIDSELLAKATPGFSGAQLEALINSAALMAAHRGGDQVEMTDVEEARDKLIMGPAKKSRVRRPEAMRLTAYHEGGHTLTALLTRGTDPLHKVTILPRGFSGGATYSLPKDEEMATRESVLAQIDVCMGGRAAEEIVYGPDKVTTGAGMDMSQASDLARRFCSLYSMSELGLSSFGNTEPSPDRKAAIDVEVEKILRQSYVRVVGLMSGHRLELDRLATALLEHETLTADECREVVDGRAIPSLVDKAAASKRASDRDRAARAAAALGGDTGAVSKRPTRRSGGVGAGGGDKEKGLWASVWGTADEEDEERPAPRVESDKKKTEWR